MKFKQQESSLDFNRLIYLFLAMILCFVIVIFRLWFLQVIHGHYYAGASERNRIRYLDVRSSRGLILDREGQCLLQNLDTYDLAITPQYFDQSDETLEKIQKIFDLTEEEIDHIKKKIQISPKFLPLVIKKNLSFQEVSIAETHKFFLTGLDVIARPSRWYKGDEQAHLIGYLGEISEKELMQFNRMAKEKNFGPYKQGALVGKNGIEGLYEVYLRGEEGRKLIQVDAHGRLYSHNDFKISKLYQDIQEKPGHDVILTISKDLQEAARSHFQDQNGALLVLKVQTSEILAYVSNPSYNLNLYVNGISKEDWLELRSNPNKPLIDKVSSGVYAPGSVYKVITAIAGLEEKVITPASTFNCPGHFNLGRGHWRCWKRSGHGPLNLLQALERSCDVYFYNLGHLVGAPKLAYWADQFGLGQKTGFELNQEHAGLNPQNDWKKQFKQEEWQLGDTINMSIGQGYVLTTPIQIANLYAAIANGGFLNRPFLTKEIRNFENQIVFKKEPELIRHIELDPQTLPVIRKSLFHVVNSPYGTARRAQSKYAFVSGKTGTAENISTQIDKEAHQDDLPTAKRDHGWFVGYAPAFEPEIVIVVLSENGGRGGAVSAPIAQKVFDFYFEQKEKKGMEQASLSKVPS